MKLTLFLLSIIVLGVSFISIANATNREGCTKVCTFSIPWCEKWQGFQCKEWGTKCLKHEWICEPEETTTPQPSATPSATPVPTEQPTVPLSPAGAPQGPVCEPIRWAPSIVWYSEEEDGAQFMWTTVENYVNKYLVEYVVDGVTYNVTVEGMSTRIYTHKPVQRIRVAGTNNGCVGPFSVWTKENVATGIK